MDSQAGHADTETLVGEGTIDEILTEELGEMGKAQWIVLCVSGSTFLATAVIMFLLVRVLKNCFFPHVACTTWPLLHPSQQDSCRSGQGA